MPHYRAHAAVCRILTASQMRMDRVTCSSGKVHACKAIVEGRGAGLAGAAEIAYVRFAIDLIMPHGP